MVGRIKPFPLKDANTLIFQKLNMYVEYRPQNGEVVLRLSERAQCNDMSLQKAETLS